MDEPTLEDIAKQAHLVAELLRDKVWRSEGLNMMGLRGGAAFEAKQVEKLAEMCDSCSYDFIQAHTEPT